MRLIDADILENQVVDLYTEGKDATEYDKAINDVIDLIDKAPTVTIKEWKEEMPLHIKDAMLEALRPTGHWFLLDECSNEGVYCSNCHKKVYRVEYANQKLKSNYCPNSGADMRGEENE